MHDKLKAYLRSTLQTLKTLLLFSAIVFPFRSSIADWNDVPSGSMRPTIVEGDRIFVNKLAYDLKVPFTRLRLATWADPQRGDIVVFFAPDTETRLVKRVIGLPGDVVELRANQLYINGEAVRYETLDAGLARLFAATGTDGAYAKEILGHHQHPVMALPNAPAMRSFSPVRVPQGQYFMMGDSRDNSRDSRYFGFVVRERIAGRAQAVVLSVDPERYWKPRWERFFTALP